MAEESNFDRIVRRLKGSALFADEKPSDEEVSQALTEASGGDIEGLIAEDKPSRFNPDRLMARVKAGEKRLFEGEEPVGDDGYGLFAGPSDLSTLPGMTRGILTGNNKYEKGSKEFLGTDEMFPHTPVSAEDKAAAPKTPIKNKLVSRFSTTSKTVDAKGSGIAAIGNKHADPDSNPETLSPQELGEEPTADELDFGKNDIDKDLQSELAKIQERKGWAYLAQGLGRMAAGFYGLHKGVDLSGVDWGEIPDYSAEEKAAFDKAKFRRQQLLEGQREVRARERMTAEAKLRQQVEINKEERAKALKLDPDFQKAELDLLTKKEAIRTASSKELAGYNAKLEKDRLKDKSGYDKELQRLRNEAKVAKGTSKYADKISEAESNGQVRVGKLLKDATHAKATDEQKKDLLGEIRLHMITSNPEKKPALDKMFNQLQGQSWWFDYPEPENFYEYIDAQVPNARYGFPVMIEGDTAPTQSAAKVSGKHPLTSTQWDSKLKQLTDLGNSPAQAEAKLSAVFIKR